MPSNIIVRRSTVLTGLVATLLSGCASIPHVEPRRQALTSQAVGIASRDTLSPAGSWWAALGDPQLDRIMADALAGNPSLDEAIARLRIAEASVATNKAGLLPQISGDVSETRVRLSDRHTTPPPYAGTSRWIGSVQANLDWSLDLAGRQKAQIQQARASASAAALDVDAARVTLSGAVAQAYINLTRATKQVEIAARFVVSRQEQLSLARTRKRTGLSSDLDLRAAETLLAEARQARIHADGDRVLMVHALAALAGRGADYYASIKAPTLVLQSGLPVSAALPADLLGRRPDILAARARIEVAEAGRKIAKADFYPDLDIKAFVGLSAIGLGSLFSGGAATYGAGPALHLPIFEGGRLKANYKGAVAGIDVAIADYNALVIGAVREATDSLSVIGTNAADAEQQEQVVDGLSETVRLDEVRVRTGLAGRLDVLSSGDRLLAASQRQVDLAAEGAAARVRLIIAFGGSFDPNNQIASASQADANGR